MNPDMPDPGDDFLLRTDPSLFRDRRRQAGVGGVLAGTVLLGYFAPTGSALQLGAQASSVAAGFVLLVMLIVTAVRSAIAWIKTADYVVVKMPRRDGHR
ncbi:hypothetical protein [Nocardia wallacei]|uniref:hypothetical protein n=1 Tax=Nocardia wallacei TaxID=480035 RepID=UPI0024561AC0|nr:hypothetical protein [Nocardia wallacei]